MEDNKNTTHDPRLTAHNSDDEINLLDYWNVLVKRKRLLALLIGVAVITSIIVSLLLPNIYQASASILPPQQETTFGPGMISQVPGGLGGLAGGIFGIQTPSDLWVGILESKTIKDAMIARFDLMNVLETEYRDDARNALGNMVNISKSKEDIITIAVENEDPKLAAEIANAYVEELDRVNRGLVMTSGKRMRTFVEERLGTAKVELAKAEEAVQTFQEENKAVQLDEQSRAIIEAIGFINGELMGKEVELQTLLSYAAPSNPQVGLLRSQIESLKTRLKELDEGHNPSSSHDILIPTSKIPGLALQYGRLLREAKIQQTLFELLTQQYEMARIKEAKDTPTVQVLDVADIPEKRSKPKRRMIVILSMVTAAFLGILLSFFLEYIERVTAIRSSP